MNKKLAIITVDGACLESDEVQRAKERRDWEVRKACGRAHALERAGDYEGGRAALGKLWTRIGERPAVDDLSPDTRAEVLWRVGALSGWLGSANQIPGAQEFARDLLTESVTLFETLKLPDKRAEAMTDLALCYWRSGAQDNGRALFQQALETAQTAQTKLRTLTNASTVEISSGRYMDALALLNDAAAFLAEVSDEMSHGCYYSQRGSAYVSLGGIENLDHGLIEYKAASQHFANAGHIRYLAGVENNIGFILLLLGRTAEALTHLDKARANFVSLKDSRMVAQVNETRARVFLAEKRFAEAERAIFAAITVLEQGDDASLLAEALTTEGNIFAGNEKYDRARSAFNRASDVAAEAGDTHFAAVAQLRMIEEIGDVLPRAELLASYRRADQYLGDRAGQSELERLGLCGDIVLDKLEKLLSVEEELIGGTLEDEKKHFEAWLIDRALERHNGKITPAARELGLTHQGLANILDGRQSKTLAGARRPKRRRHKSIIRRTL
jgi:tetratricopeptide (TPR) repeat protein